MAVSARLRQRAQVALADHGAGKELCDAVDGSLVGQLVTVGGQLTTATAADTVVTGLTTVTSVVASYETDPADANDFVSAQIGDQAGTPAAGSIIIKTWKSADGADVTPTAATAFSKKVNWIAFGTK